MSSIPLTSTIFPHKLSLGSLSSEENDHLETSNLDSLHIIPDCGSLHTLMSAAGGILSNDNWLHHQSISITEYH